MTIEEFHFKWRGGAIERKIGEVYKKDGKKIKCIKAKSKNICIHCIYDGKQCSKDENIDGPCNKINRSDKTYVKFVEVKMKNSTIAELMKEITGRLCFDLKENEIICPDCGGLHWVPKIINGNEVLERCQTCHTGKLYKCPYCEKLNNCGACNCNGHYKASREMRDKEEVERKKLTFEKATKIKFEDYKGYGIFIGDTLFSTDDEDGIIEQLIEEIKEGLEPSKYFFGTTPDAFHFDIEDSIYDSANDFCEDGASYLHFKEKKFKKGIKLLNRWLKEGNLTVYYEDETTAVLMGSLIEKAMKIIKEED